MHHVATSLNWSLAHKIFVFFKGLDCDRWTRDATSTRRRRNFAATFREGREWIRRRHRCRRLHLRQRARRREASDDFAALQRTRRAASFETSLRTGRIFGPNQRDCLFFAVFEGNLLTKTLLLNGAFWLPSFRPVWFSCLNAINKVFVTIFVLCKTKQPFYWILSSILNEPLANIFLFVFNFDVCFVTRFVQVNT